MRTAEFCSFLPTVFLPNAAYYTSIDIVLTLEYHMNGASYEYHKMIDLRRNTYSCIVQLVFFWHNGWKNELKGHKICQFASLTDFQLVLVVVTVFDFGYCPDLTRTCVIKNNSYCIRYKISKYLYHWMFSSTINTPFML